MLLENFIETYAVDTGQTLESDYREGEFSVYMVSIAGILSTMESCDSYSSSDDLDQSWSTVFEDKRCDEGYSELVDSIMENGILTPFCILYDSSVFGDTIHSFHNGNHRLAAAVELGYTHVPIVFVNRDWDFDIRWDLTQLGGYDCGSEWDYGDREELLTLSMIEPVLIPARPAQPVQLSLAV